MLCAAIESRPALNRGLPASLELSSAEQAAWQPLHLPGKRKTHFLHRFHKGRHAVEATANSSASVFRRPMHIPAKDWLSSEPGALTGIALMTDTDNTQSKATAWYGPVSLVSRNAVAP